MAPRKKGTKAIEHQNFELLILSDWHLGSRLCNLDYLIEFLQHNNANTIILLGDIWEELHEYKYKAEKIAVVEQLLLDKLNRGTAFFFLPGNHDFTRAPHAKKFTGNSAARKHMRRAFARTGHDILSHPNMHITTRMVLEINGDRHLIEHGDACDSLMHNKNGQYVGTKVNEYGAYGLSARMFRKIKRAFTLMRINVYLNELNAHVKEFNRKRGRRRKVDAVVCGHTHMPDNSTLKSGVRYYNTGDWTEHCTALVQQHKSARLELVQWRKGEGFTPYRSHHNGPAPNIAQPQMA